MFSQRKNCWIDEKVQNFLKFESQKNCLNEGPNLGRNWAENGLNLGWKWVKNDWSEFRDWSEFWLVLISIGPNFAKFWHVVFDALFWHGVFKNRKKQLRVKCWNRKIGVDWSRQRQKRFLLTQVSLQKISSRLATQKVLIWQEVQ
jgi:hypothetical protein